MAIETSRRRGSVALQAGAQILEAVLEGERSHASDLLPRLERLLEASGARGPRQALELDSVLVGTGPGSYTGLRVGIAAAQGLAWAAGARLIGIPSFEALVLAELAPGQEGSVALDARAGRFYFARYRRTESGVEVLEPPSALSSAELRERLPGAGPIFGDEGVAALELGPGAFGRLRTDCAPRASALLPLGIARGAPPTPGPVEPLYLFDFGRRGSSGSGPPRR